MAGTAARGLGARLAGDAEELRAGEVDDERQRSKGRSMGAVAARFVSGNDGAERTEEHSTPASFGRA